ncbi:MAG: hypothetical protein KAW49_11805 [Anaerolineae bacterium]|nr:hypothetical protein [Anaerolineae bacterium]
MKAEIAWVRRSPNRLVLDVTLDRPGFLVLGQVWYPEWTAEVDGQPATLWRADGMLSGVYLEDGSHRVMFVYWPAGLGADCGVTIVGWVAAAALCLKGHR